MRKQPNSKLCFVCGRENPIGLHLQFFTDAENRVHARFTPCLEHQSYPGILHGGLISTLLDETIGRTAIASDLWCMTVKLLVRFRKPVPLNQEIRLTGEMTRKTGRLLEGRGVLQLQDGTVAAEATGTFIRIPEDQIEPYRTALEWWRVDE